MFPTMSFFMNLSKQSRPSSSYLHQDNLFQERCLRRHDHHSVPVSMGRTPIVRSSQEIYSQFLLFLGHLGIDIIILIFEYRGAISEKHGILCHVPH